MNKIHFRKKICDLHACLFIALIYAILLQPSNLLGHFNEGDSIITDLQSFCSGQKGFNLLGKFDVSWSNEGYDEDDFSMINELGFNFVRLPVDYRSYTQAGDWDIFLEQEVEEIDKAIEWGIKYDVHVCLNLHRAPGYCVNYQSLPANQDLDLWSDTLAQKAFVNHWDYFATRYQDIPPSRLSFNLVNEPNDVSESAYLNVMTMALSVIRNVSPERIVFIDGLNYGRDLIPALKDEEFVAQSMHSYDPFNITHYKAEWVNGSENMPPPRWPMLWVSNYLYGPWKSEFKSPLIIHGSFEAGTEIIVNVHQVSTQSKLQIKADDAVIYTKNFICTADTGQDFSVVVETEWGYQNISDKDFSVTMENAATSLSFENVAGDWMTINSISFKKGSQVTVLHLSDNSWGKKQGEFVLEKGILKTLEGEDLLPFEEYRKNVELAKENNIAFMVQEFGVYNKTPHDITIAFLSDLMNFFLENDIGWSLWNFQGSFGVLNSGRTDCNYDTFHGNSLDSEMLDILLRESSTRDIRGLKIYPLPSSDKIYFTPGENSENLHIAVYDISGRLMYTDQFQSGFPEKKEIDIRHMQKGMYILKAFNGTDAFCGKFMVGGEF